MKKPLLLFLFSFIYIFVHSATITSTTGGGSWSNNLTWVGGVIPGLNDDVIINGPVDLNSNTTINSLTVNASKTLTNSGFHYSLTVNGNVTNNGTITTNPSWNLLLYIKGNIVNNGTWSPRETYLSGTGMQYLSQAAGMKFERAFYVTGTAGVTLLSNIRFENSTLNLGGSTLTCGSFRFEGVNQFIQTGTISSSDTLYTPNSVLTDITLNGNYKILGKTYIEGNSSIWNGTATLCDTLMDYFYNISLIVNGNLINKGVVKIDPNNWSFTIYAKGNITNYGYWKPTILFLNGTGNQTISQIGATKYQGHIQCADSLGDIILGSNVNYEGSNFDLGNSRLVTNGFILNIQNASFYNGKIQSNDTLIINRSNSWTLKFYGDYKIKGKWQVRDNIFLNGTFTLIDTLMDDYYHHIVYILGDIINKGVIIRDPNNWTIKLYCYGNVINEGYWAPTELHFRSSSNQFISQNTTNPFYGYIVNDDTLGDILLASNISIYGNTFELGGSRLNTNGFNALFLNNRIQNGKIQSNDTLHLQNTSIINLSFFGNYVIEGKVLAESGLKFYGTYTQLDTLMDNAYHYHLYVYGNMINKGVLMIHPNNWSLNMHILGNLENRGVWTPTNTYLEGNAAQFISQTTGTNYRGYFYISDTVGSVTFTTPIIYQGPLFDMGNESVQFGSNKFTALNSRVANGSINSIDTIHFHKTSFININFYGNYVLEGKAYAESGLNFYGTYTQVDTLLDNAYHYHLNVYGNMINKGVLLIHPNNWSLNMHIYGNLENRGVWTPTTTYFEGNAAQTISQTPGTNFRGYFYFADTIGSINAGSDIVYKGPLLDLGNETFNLGNYKLLMNDNRLANGTIFSTDTLTLTNTSSINTRFIGDYKIKGKFLVESNMNFDGQFTLLDTLLNNFYNYSININGDLRNEGEIRNSGNGWVLTIVSKGSIINNSQINIYALRLQGKNPRNISGLQATTMGTTVYLEDSIVLIGDNALPNLSNSNPANYSLTLTPGASLDLNSISTQQSIYNYGRLGVTLDIDSNNIYTNTFYKATAVNKKGTKVSKIKIENYGYQEHPTTAGAVKTWWRVRNTPQLYNDTLVSLKLFYLNDQLNGSPEDSLKVFHSSNSGIDWKQIKTGVTIDKVNKGVTITNAPSFGHYVLASKALGVITFRPQIERAEPRTGGNTGMVTIYGFGAGFKPTSVAKLRKSGSADIVADTTYITDLNGESFLAKFNLKGALIGTWDVVIETPGDSTLILPNYFTVQAGKRSKPWASITARDRFLVNTWTNFYLNYGNTSNSDALGIPIIFAISDAPGLQLQIPDVNFVVPKFLRDQGHGKVADSAALYYVTDTLTGYQGKKMRVYPFYVPYITAGSSDNIRIRVKLSASSALSMAVWTQDPYWEAISYTEATEPMPAEVRACITLAAMKYYSTNLISMVPIPGFGCVNIADKIFDPAQYVVPDNMLPEEKKEKTWGDLFWSAASWGSATIQCAASFVPGVGTVVQVGMGITNMIIDSKDNLSAEEGCWRKFRKKNEGKKNSNGVNSMDPNEITGPQGYTADNYVLKTGNFNYTVYFENKNTATAPANQVFVYDTLDKAKFDLSTFSFGKITISDTSVAVQAFAKEFTLLFDLYPKRDVVVKVYGKLDTSTGAIYMAFTSLQRLTLDTVEDPDGGFLPPNTLSPKGEANFSYNVGLKQNIAHNTYVQNKASIIFDGNAPITTNLHSNRIDTIAPTSSVNALSPYQTDSSFTVSWAGNDQGCGLHYYTVFVSVNDSDYKVWKNMTTATLAVYHGRNKLKYEFFSIAMDSLGLTELSPAVADAITTVNVNVGINELTSENITLFPNPTHGNCTLAMDASVEESIEIRITDLAGRTLIDKEFSLQPGRNELLLPLANQASGVYFVTVQGNNFNFTRKLILN